MNFLKVAWDDLKKIKSNTYIAIAMIAVILVPLVYGGLYLAAFWDPYGHTENIDVAVVNLDKGTTNDGKVINAGDGVMEALKDNDDIGWKPVKDRKTALEGVYNKKYFAMITIPEDFSEKLLAAKDGIFEKPKVEFITNRKTNYIVSLINDKAAEMLRAKISASFAKAFTKEVFNKFHEVKDGLLDASEGSGQLKSGMFVAKDGAQKLNNGLEKLRGKVPELESGVNQLFNGASDLSNAIITNDKDSKGDPKGLIQGIACLSSGLYDAKDGSQELDDGVGELQDGVIDLQDATRKLNEAVNFGRDGKQSLVAGVEDLYDGVVNPDSSKGLGAAISELNKAVNEGKDGKPSLVSGITDIRNGINYKLSPGIALLNNKLNGDLAKAEMKNLVMGITELNRQVQLPNVNNKENSKNADNEGSIKSESEEITPGKQNAALLAVTNISGRYLAAKVTSIDNKSNLESKNDIVINENKSNTEQPSVDIKDKNIQTDSNVGEVSSNTTDDIIKVNITDDIKEKANQGLKDSVFDESKKGNDPKKIQQSNEKKSSLDKTNKVEEPTKELTNEDKVNDSIFGQSSSKVELDNVSGKKDTGLLPKVDTTLSKDNGEVNKEVPAENNNNKNEVKPKDAETNNKAEELPSKVNENGKIPDKAEEKVAPNTNVVEENNTPQEPPKEVVKPPVTILVAQPTTTTKESSIDMSKYENPMSKVISEFENGIKYMDKKQNNSSNIAIGVSGLYNCTLDELIPGIAKLNLGINIGDDKGNPSLVESVSKLHLGSELLNANIKDAVEKLKSLGITKEILNSGDKNIKIQELISKVNTKDILNIINKITEASEAIDKMNSGLEALDNNISTILAPGIMKLYAGVTGLIPNPEIIVENNKQLSVLKNRNNSKEKTINNESTTEVKNHAKNLQVQLDNNYKKGVFELTTGDKEAKEKVLSSSKMPSIYTGIKALHEGITGIDPTNPYKNKENNEKLSNSQDKPTSSADVNEKSKVPNINEKSLAAGIGKIYSAITGNNPITEKPLTDEYGKPVVSPITQLQKGIAALNEGVNGGKDGKPGLAQGIDEIYHGITDPDETKGLAAAIKELNKAINIGKDGKKSMVDGVSELHDAIVNPDPEEGLAAAVQKLYDGITIGVDGNKALVEGVQELKDGTSQLAPGLNEAYDGVQKLSDGAYELSDGAMQLKDGVGTLNGKIPSLANGVNSLAYGSNDLYDGMNELLDGSVSLNSALTKGADKIADKLVIDSRDASDFASDAVKLKKKSMYEIKNYGTGFAPYFISLGLWVGALLMFFIISDNVDEKLNASTVSVVIGKYLTYAIVGVIQAVGLSLFVMALGLRPSSVSLYIGFNIFLSLVFIAIIQNLIYLAGDVGRLTATVALLLQLTACGGTFPEQLLPGFFRAINPYVPFTYCVSALREIICGPDFKVLNKDITILSIVGIAFFTLTLALKCKANKVKHHIEEKYSTSI